MTISYSQGEQRQLLRLLLDIDLQLALPEQGMEICLIFIYSICNGPGWVVWKLLKKESNNKYTIAI